MCSFSLKVDVGLESLKLGLGLGATRDVAKVGDVEFWRMEGVSCDAYAVLGSTLGDVVEPEFTGTTALGVERSRWTCSTVCNVAGVPKLYRRE